MRKLTRVTRLACKWTRGARSAKPLDLRAERASFIGGLEDYACEHPPYLSPFLISNHEVACCGLTECRTRHAGPGGLWWQAPVDTVAP